MLIKNTFVHHVHFWLKDKAELQNFIEGVHLLATISPVRRIHIGVPADTHRSVVDRSYDVSLLVFFDNLAEHDAYQVDATHDIFVEKYIPLCDRVVVMDCVDA
jgi:hypothetical protein